MNLGLNLSVLYKLRDLLWHDVMDHPVIGIGDPGDEEKQLIPIAGGQGMGWSPGQSGSKRFPTGTKRWLGPMPTAANKN